MSYNEMKFLYIVQIKAPTYIYIYISKGWYIYIDFIVIAFALVVK